jgi:hypothetical protein
MKLNPQEWSLLTWRLYGLSVVLIVVIFIVAFVVLRERILKMPWIALAVAAFIAMFSFLWLAGAEEYGSYKKGFLWAIAYIVLVSTGISLLRRMLLEEIRFWDLARLALALLIGGAIISRLEGVSLRELLFKDYPLNDDET